MDGLVWFFTLTEYKGTVVAGTKVSNGVNTIVNITMRVNVTRKKHLSVWFMSLNLLLFSLNVSSSVEFS
ncbi:hypothetical protein WICPIJ_005397 [Wickerhamomyces pijperi]|uniref:Uncharacterized protein n=1 Tax=Wickerhamomyces pijperi TaxID=599730 RepID=A0A9P8TM03_WICPI|nr:hypothetical protein WICPIJ_005397 [Wickerhamomyces pijperi]